MWDGGSLGIISGAYCWAHQFFILSLFCSSLFIFFLSFFPVHEASIKEQLVLVLQS